MNQEKLLKVGSLVGIFLVIFLAVVSIKQLASIKYIGKETPVYNSISVTGKGEAVAIPDVATFSFSVEETAKTVDEAQTKATAKMDAALAKIKAGGVAEKDIKTLSYSINPKYEYNQGVCTQYVCPVGKQVLIGYEVAQSVQVKVRELKNAGELFSAISAAGIQNVNGLSFGIDNTDDLKAEARAEAIAQAKAKAQKIADDLGVRLVKITSYYDSSDEPYPYYSARAEGMGGDMMAMNIKAAAPQVPTGEQKITASVTITYEIR